MVRSFTDQMPVGRYFTYEEMINTSHDVMNTPGDIQFRNMVRLVALVLDPLRAAVGTLGVNSGFRTEALNSMVGGADGSFHVKGCAADIYHKNMTPAELIQKALDLDLPFDKAIDENLRRKSWLHIQIAEPHKDHRLQVYHARMVKGSVKYTAGFASV